ncbi:hypothetical protein [Mariprofundus ferrooxydans]|jgi:D-hexose-6-phosphate mutarotase|uniref:Uncharacterized protein n=1 Tax=Mariprofundus ferrooxydans PV-1 TaxID=314345 RepID=Q0EW09_9PROT|nr:hypothetical protein [Mariprofundus ferrooxydans]EAU53459.1 hypothetical protein SPV1_12952 [Mariprofundus ferrooxydans PV-1]KON46399.1 hypothetical protein AL013_13345 [Mariprofundus ferrooxydans]
MAFIEEQIEQFLDAIDQVYGEEYRNSMIVESRGNRQILVKHPEHQEGNLVTLGTLELMTKSLLDQAKEAA